ncbi:MAG: glycosyltransferase [Candidatus Berkelbacteria bacterium]
MSSQNHDVTVISIYDPWKEKQKSGTADAFDHISQKVRIFKLTRKKISPIFQEIFSFAYLRILEDKLELSSYDVHLNYSSLALGYAVSKKIERYSTPTIYDIADNLPEMAGSSPLLDVFLRPLAKTVARFFLSKNIALSSRITVPSASLGKLLGLPALKTEVLHNGVDFSKFKERNKTRSSKLKICYLGVLREWVALDKVILSIKGIDKSVELHIIGKEGDYQKYRELVVKNYLQKSVFFHGVVPYSMVPDALSKMDVGILPFLNSPITNIAFPLKVLEYTAAGLAIVSSPLTEVVDTYGDNIIYATSQEEWHNAFVLLLSNHTKYIKRIVNLKKSLYRFDWSNISNKLEKLMLSVVSEQKRR